MNTTKTDTVIISDEMKATLDALKNSHPAIMTFTAEQDAIILAYWPIKNKKQMAKLLKISENTIRKRYDILTNA